MKSAKKITITAIETADCYFVKDDNLLASYYLVNGVKPETTWQNNWLKVDKPIEKLEKILPQKIVTEWLELKDPSLECAKIPRIIKSFSYDDDICEYVPDAPYENLRELYKYERKMEDQPPEGVEFELNIVQKWDKLEPPVDFDYDCGQATINWKKHPRRIQHRNVDYDTINKILFPNLALHETSCSLTSKQTYDIVREHIKNKIDKRYAIITSDYDFCFTVSKKIQITPEEHTYVSLFDKKKKPQKKMVSSRNVEIFNMTHEEKGYQSYPIIKGFKAKNLKQLKEMIDIYLEELMKYINEPLVECECCKGQGVIFDKNFEMNERNA